MSYFQCKSPKGFHWEKKPLVLNYTAIKLHLSVVWANKRFIFYIIPRTYNTYDANRIFFSVSMAHVCTTQQARYERCGIIYKSFEPRTRTRKRVNVGSSFLICRKLCQVCINDRVDVSPWISFFNNDGRSRT